MRDRETARLFLVRHAETEWNAAQLFQGHLDSELTPRGLQQAAQLAGRLEGEGIAAVYSSDQRRALRTAEVVASRLGLRVISTPRLREIDCGEWTGKGFDEVPVRWPEDHENWRLRPQLHRMPGGESVQEVQDRGLAFVRQLLGRHRGQSVCAVTHNTIVRAVVCALMGWTLEKMWEAPRQPNCAINVIELSNGHPRLVDIGHTDHLVIDRPAERALQPERDTIV